jgi:hypothetical protein
MKLQVGDWVEVRSKEEILRSLDAKGQLEGMPFMPQMFRFCGQRFSVYKRAHKTCDTVNPIRGMRVPAAVHLDLRCDGEAYGGCQAGCLLFWKTAWLKPVGETGSTREQALVIQRLEKVQEAPIASCTEADVWAARYAEGSEAGEGPRYCCQATQLPSFSTFLPWWDVRQYIEDYISGNATLTELFRGSVFAGYTSVIKAGVGLGSPLRWLYDRVQLLWGGMPFPGKTGTIPVGAATPVGTLDLQAGEVVRVKSYNEILATLDTESKNRGLRFDAEMTPYCGHTYRVRTRVSKYIDEKTGKLLSLNSAAVILEGASCQSRYSTCRMFCPRSIYAWWREIWLERVPEMERGIPLKGAEVETSPGK